MAAPITSGLKLSKSERKALKKHQRIKHTLYKQEQLKITNEPTQHIVVNNGGLDNNVQHEELVNIFSQYGTVLDVIMKPQKPYAFVTFTTVDASLEAFQQTNGKTMRYPDELSVPNVVFYLSYVEEVPGFEVPSSALPPGLLLVENIISEADELRWLEGINWDTPDLSDGANQSMKHRKVKHYGYEFLYGINNVDLSKPLQEGIPPMCDQVLNNLIETGHMSQYPDQLTINQYQPGQGIPSHIDTHSAFEDVIISISLGSQVVMDFHHPDGRHIPILLPQCSALIMCEESRYVWTHGITPRKSDIIKVSGLGQQNNQSGPVKLSDDGRHGVGAEACEGMSTGVSTGVSAGEMVPAQRLSMVKRGTRTSFTFRNVLHGPCCCKYPEKCDSQQARNKMTKEENESVVVMPDSDQQAATLENLHVHQVYEEIADHFSDTRHKAWPKVAEFLTQQSPGSIILDIGCGNGKYMGINHDTYKIGCDRSINLCEICRGLDFQVLACDVLAVPYRDNCCDVAISIAVIHHLSTWERRLRAVQEMVRVLRPGGKALISVWALEQELNKKKSNYLKKSKIQKKEIMQDGLQCTDDITVSSESLEKRDRKTSTSSSHGETLVMHMNRTHFDNQDLLVPWHKKKREVRQQSTTDKLACEIRSVDILSSGSSETVYHRFYHVFKENELKHLVESVVNISVIHEYYDKGNWCVIFEKTE